MATTKAHDLARLLADGVVGTTEIGDAQVTTAKVADSAITADKLATSSVTADKLSIASSDVPYDNTVSGLSANTIKEAIDALNAISGGGNAGAQATFSREKFTATAGQTSFTVTGGYDVGYLLVFMNGVLLDISDFTASDGVGFTLAVAAKAGDEIVAIKLDSFAIAELLRIFNTSASAPDDAVTVDASGSLLVGKTSAADINTNGFQVESNGRTGISRNSGSALLLNRTSSDGPIALFRKNGSTVGSIGSEGGGGTFFIGSGDVTLGFNAASDIIIPRGTNAANRTDAIDLGNGSNRFKDLYLSGGVYLGGTGSANKLDDVETGTFTPTITGGLQSGGTAAGQYTKVGGLVQINLRIYRPADNSSSTDISIGGLPFAASNIGSEQVLNLAVRYANMANWQIAGFSVTSGASSGAIRIFAENSGDFDALQHVAFTSNFSTVVVSGTYQTDA